MVLYHMSNALFVLNCVQCIVKCVLSVVCQSDEGNILFKDALNILFTVVWYQDNGKKTIQIVRDKTCCHHFMGYSFRLAAMALLYAPSHRQHIPWPLNPIVVH